jgi:polyhydroxyalkanoate synthesis repressor PhaR
VATPLVVKKYGNRRLYDTEESRYVTLEELADKVRAGRDVRVLDAKTSADLTQVTLAQIILESRGAARMLPVPLLTQLIRMGDDALAEFMGRWVSAALEMYFQARQGAEAISPYVPMATAPFAATNALARLLLGAGSMLGVGHERHAPPPIEVPPPPPPSAASASDVDDLRRELDELKTMLRAAKRTTPKKRR